MKKTLLILSAIAVSGTAFLVAQDDRPAPRGGRGGGGGMFANAPLFKALGINEEGDIAVPKADAEAAAKIAFADKIIACDTDKNGKLSRTEMFGEFRRRGGGGAGGGQRDGARPDRPQRPPAE